MASSNILDRIDNSYSRLETKIDAQETRYMHLIWTIMLATLFLSAVMVILRLV
ncbi:MAG: hypothetical protein OXI05_07000 [Bacteroidota bacterium]|nr:hypothetical protein [Bacteroidota bacterium]MDE2645568.1 hypothetical protein [Bacteroidota bacterium]